jgi:hypothetical protein
MRKKKKNQPRAARRLTRLDLSNRVARAAPGIRVAGGFCCCSVWAHTLIGMVARRKAARGRQAGPGFEKALRHSLLVWRPAMWRRRLRGLMLRGGKQRRPCLAVLVLPCSKRRMPTRPSRSICGRKSPRLGWWAGIVFGVARAHAAMDR